MPKRPSNHPKTDLSTGLDWWTSHLHQESRVDYWWDDYEVYDDPQPHQHVERRSTVSARPAQKPAERNIPGTDAWINAQAEKRKGLGGGKARKEDSSTPTLSQAPAMHQSADDPPDDEVVVAQEAETYESRPNNPTTRHASAKHLDVDKDDHQERTEWPAGVTSDRYWRVVFFYDENIVAITPPTNPALDDWKDVRAWDPKGTALHDAIYAHELWIRSLVLIASNEIQREISNSLVVRLPPAEFEQLKRELELDETFIAGRQWKALDDVAPH
ncbi:MAG: hypothetical protein Q9184_002563 [Pyrenodesmia sp. 2 TL-2023]